MADLTPPRGPLTLAFPQSLAVHDTYEEAQRTVDHLADREFPVENCLIVGTDLKSLERITGRLTWSKVAVGGLLSGLWLGAFIGLVFMIFTTEDALALMLTTALMGALFGLIWALIGYGLSRGRRDFTSVRRVVATRYEVLVEHKYAEQAHALLAELPGARRDPFA